MSREEEGASGRPEDDPASRTSRVLGATLPRRPALLAATLCVVAAGLALRKGGYALGLPFFVVKYGGSILWGSMVYLIVAAILTGRSGKAAAGLALALAVAVELFRLHHTPALDAFRLTTPGALLLGRVFSPWNILAYAIGIGAAAGLDRLCQGSRPTGRRSPFPTP